MMSWVLRPAMSAGPPGIVLRTFAHLRPLARTRPAAKFSVTPAVAGFLPTGTGVAVGGTLVAVGALVGVGGLVAALVAAAVAALVATTGAAGAATPPPRATTRPAAP